MNVIETTTMKAFYDLMCHEKCAISKLNILEGMFWSGDCICMSTSKDGVSQIQMSVL